MNRFTEILFYVLLAAALMCISPTRAAPPEMDVDVCVYGATPSGILAAVAVKGEGHTVVILEPSRWVGGMLGAGLKPTQDCPNIHATGGLTRELLTSLGQFVVEPDGTKVRRHESNRSLHPKDIREDFLGAAGLLRISRFMIDPRDDRDVARFFEVVGTDEGIFGCLGLMACEDICPKGIPLQKQLAAVRRALAWAALSGKIR